MLDTLMFVKENPWRGLGIHYDNAPRTSKELVSVGKMDWGTDYLPMYTEKHQTVPHYNAVYRTDTNDVLAVVNARHPIIVQNVDTFNAFDFLIDKEVDVDTAGLLEQGKKVFACFKVREQYKIIDDDVDHYFVVINEHDKVDGKVTVLNTPVRIVCQNVLSSAMSKSFYKLRVPVSNDKGLNMDVSENIIRSVSDAAAQLQSRAQKMLNQKTTGNQLDIVLDEIFPFLPDSNEKKNMKIEMERTTFLEECMKADNLSNYEGTAYQIYNALVDYTQHYFKNADKAYDLEYRMNTLPGMSPASPTANVIKFLSIKDDLFAA